MQLLNSVFCRTRFFLKSILHFRLKSANSHMFWCQFSFNLKQMSSTVAVGKPPNVLIYTGDNREHVFKNATFNLLKYLNPDKYVVYELKKAQVLLEPWEENTVLLILICDTIEEITAEAFRSYLTKNGKILAFCSNFAVPQIGFSSEISNDGFIKIKYKKLDAVEVYHGKVAYKCPRAKTIVTDENNVPVLVKADLGHGILVASEVHLLLEPSALLRNEEKTVRSNEKIVSMVLKNILAETFCMEVSSIMIPEPSFAYVISKNDSELSALISKLNIEDIPFDKDNKLLKVPLIYEDQMTDTIPFDKNAYFSKLKSQNFGHIVIFFPIVTSTMIPAEYLSNQEGVVVIAGRQTCGRGRGGNQWISPEGCAMFTLHFTLSLSSRLGQRMSIVQHMATLAVVLGIKKIPGYENLNLHLKWPNDLFFEHDKKIGGVIVNTTIQGNAVHCYVGIGVNVSNQHPTVCVNSAIDIDNSRTGGSLTALKPEEVIACTLSELEGLVNDFMKHGSENFLSLYYSCWLHGDQQVTLSSLKKEAIVKGIDDYGFLIVETEEGRKLTLQPDGNRFDIMKNLIIAKK